MKSDSPPHQKPAETRQSVAMIVIGLVMFFLCATVSVYVIGKNPRLLDRFRAMVGADEGARKSSRVASLPAHPTPVAVRIPVTLLKPSVTYADADFSLYYSFGQTDFCQAVGVKLPGLALQWKQGLLSTARSDCDGFVSSSADAANGTTNSLFVQIRRNRSGATSGIRLKLVDRPQSQGPRYSADFQKAAETILERIYGDKPDYVDAKLSNLERFAETRRGIAVELSKEVLFEGAYNLTIKPVCGKFNCPENSRYYKLSEAPSADEQGQSE